MDHTDLDFLIGELNERLLDSLNRTVYVRLNDDVQILDAVRDSREQILERCVCIRLELLVLCLVETLLRKGTRHSLILNCVELITRNRYGVKTDDLNRYGRTCDLDLLTLVVGHGTDVSDRSARDDDVARMERTVLYKHGGNGSAALIQLCLDNDTLCTAVGICFQLLDLGNEQDVFEQVVDTHAGHCRNGNADDIAAPLLGNQLILGKTGHNIVRICRGLIHLVDGYDDLNARGLCVVDRLYRLRHDAVVGCNDQDRNIGCLRTSCTHGGERLVTGRVEEGNIFAIDVDSVCTDVLRDTACLTVGNIGVADRVEQRGLTVVNVTHNADNGVTRQQRFFAVLCLVEELLLDGDDHFSGDLGAEFIGNEVCGVKVYGLVERCHNAHHHQSLDDLGSGDLQSGRQLLYGDLIGHRDLELLLARLFELHLFDALALFILCLAVLTAGILLLQLLTVGAVVRTVGTCEYIQLFIVSGEIDLGGTRIDHAHASARLCGAVIRGNALHLADRRGKLLHRAALIALVLVKSALATIVRTLLPLRLLIIEVRTSAAVLKRLALEAIAEVSRLLRCAALTEAVILRTVALRTVAAVLRTVALSVAIALRTVVLRAILIIALRARLLLRLRTGLCCRTGSLLDRLCCAHRLCTRLCLRLCFFLCQSIRLRLCLGCGFCLCFFFCLSGSGSFCLCFRLGCGSLCLCFCGSLRLYLFGSSLLPFRNNDNIAVQVGVKVADLIFLTEDVHDQTEFIRIKSSRRGLALDSAGSENIRDILALHAELLCQLTDTVLLKLCHSLNTCLVIPGNRNDPFFFQNAVKLLY